MPILHLSQLIGVAAGLDGVGAEVQAARRLGRARHREIRGLKPAVAVAGRRPRVGPLRGRLGAAARAARAAPRLPEELDGLRIAHLSDFHLGLPSRGERAVERAVEWVVERQPDLTLISGDLVSRPRGERKLLELLDRLPHVLRRPRQPRPGRHARPVRAPVADARARARRRCSPTRRGRSRCAAGGCRSPASIRGRTRSGMARPDELADPTADLRILLCHFPGVIDKLGRGSFDLVLAGHLHAGQICVPFRGGRLRLAHCAGSTSRGCTSGPAGRSTSRRGSARPSSRSASSRGRRRRSSSYNRRE